MLKNVKLQIRLDFSVWTQDLNVKSDAVGCLLSLWCNSTEVVGKLIQALIKKNNNNSRSH